MARRKAVEIAAQGLSEGRRRLCSGVYQSCAEWASRQGAPVNDQTAACFIAARAMEDNPPTAKTLAGYAGALKTVLSMDKNPTLPQMARGLRREAAEDKTTKALPLCDIDRIRVARVLPELAVPMWLAIETSSRWDEIGRLKREDFVVDWRERPHVIVVTWATTKAEQEGTTRSDHTTLLRPPFPREFVAWLETAHPTSRLTRVSTRKVTEGLRHIVPWDPASPGPNQQLRERYTAHSFKRTGVDRDVTAAAAAERKAPGSGAELLRKASVRAKHLNVDNTRGYTTRVGDWAVAAAGAKL